MTAYSGVSELIGLSLDFGVCGLQGRFGSFFCLDECDLLDAVLPGVSTSQAVVTHSIFDAVSPDSIG
jgi:hypothetical protein